MCHRSFCCMTPRKVWLHLLCNLQLGSCRQQYNLSSPSLQAEQTQLSQPLLIRPTELRLLQCSLGQRPCVKKKHSCAQPIVIHLWFGSSSSYTHRDFTACDAAGWNYRRDLEPNSEDVQIFQVSLLLQHRTSGKILFLCAQVSICRIMIWGSSLIDFNYEIHCFEIISSLWFYNAY